jgi:hypothetical protein
MVELKRKVVFRKIVVKVSVMSFLHLSLCRRKCWRFVDTHRMVWCVIHYHHTFSYNIGQSRNKLLLRQLFKKFSGHDLVVVPIVVCTFQ